MTSTRAILFAVAAAAIPLVLVPALADPYPQEGDCDAHGAPALERIEITSGSALATFYVDDENYVEGGGLWIYQESNGVWLPKAPGVYLEGHSNADLQRGQDYTDCIWSLGGCEICADGLPSGIDWHDTMIF